MEIIAGHREEVPLPDSHRHLPMQSQIALMFIAIMLAFGVFASLLNSWFIMNNFEDHLNQKSARYIQSIFNEYEGHSNRERANYLNNLNEILKDDDITFIGIFDRKREAILNLGDEIEVPALVFDHEIRDIEIPVIENNIRYYKYSLPSRHEIVSSNILKGITPSSRNLSYIIVAANEENVVQTALNAFVWTFIITMVAAAVMMLFGIFVIRIFTKPFYCLSKAMVNAQLGQRGVRVTPDGASEIYNMGTSFNAMIAVLERREERLLAQKKNLLKQVNDRQSAEQALNSITMRLQAIYNNVSDGIVVVDKACSIVSMNPSANNIYGYEKGEIINERLGHIMKLEFISMAINNLKVRKLGEKIAIYETVAICKSGKTTPIEVGVSKMDVSGEEHYLLTVRDIAERQRSDEELNAYKLHLEAMVHEQTKDIAESRDAAMAGEKAMSSFLANMSHELRTPMHGVLSFANIALRKVDSISTDRIKEYLNEIRVSGNNLLKIINDLLDLSKMKSGKMKYSYSNVIFSNIIKNVTREMAILCEKEEVLFDTTISGNEMHYDLDESRLSQVVRNLYSNAIKFADPKTTIEVNLAYQDNEKIIFTIFNYGVRVPKDECESVFDSFIQSSLTRSNAGGTGLGLPICKEIIEAGHGGTIIVDVDVDNGAKFIVEIPFIKRVDDVPEANLEISRH